MLAKIRDVSRYSSQKGSYADKVHQLLKERGTWFRFAFNMPLWVGEHRNNPVVDVLANFDAQMSWKNRG